jgi:hypothetical protein
VPGRGCIAHRLIFLASNGIEPGSAVAVSGLFFRQEIERMPVNIVVVGGAVAVMGSVKVEGWLAKCFYVSLYRMHQVALFGLVRTGLRVLGDRIGSSTETRLKLHKLTRT